MSAVGGGGASGGAPGVAVEDVDKIDATQAAVTQLLIARHKSEDFQIRNMASVLEIDAVIDPAETRAWILRGLRSVPPDRRGAGRDGRRRFVDAW